MATPCQLERFCIFRRLLACRALQRIQIGCSDIEPKLLGRGWRNLRPGRAQGGRQMFFVAAVLAILSGLFYAAGRHVSGSLGCRDVPIRQSVLRQSTACADGCRIGCVLGRICQRALKILRSFAMIPLCR
jgi:hypothetical protein